MEITLTRSCRNNYGKTSTLFIGEINPNTTKDFKLTYHSINGNVDVELGNLVVNDIANFVLFDHRAEFGGWGDVMRNWDKFIKFLDYFFDKVKDLIGEEKYGWFKEAIQKAV